MWAYRRRSIVCRAACRGGSCGRLARFAGHWAVVRDGKGLVLLRLSWVFEKLCSVTSAASHKSQEESLRSTPSRRMRADPVTAECPHPKPCN